MRTLVLALLGCLLAAAPGQAATLQVDAFGQLTGATGVSVNGSLYDVSFQDGSCFDVFTTCDATTDFTFKTNGDAFLAAEALLNQVFLDTASGQFDSDPSKIFGCTSTAACRALVPYFFISNAVVSFNAVNFGSVISLPDVPQFDLTLSTTDFSLDGTRVWAVFSPSAVPLPGTLVLFLSGLFGFAVMAHRRAHNRVAAKSTAAGL